MRPKKKIIAFIGMDGSGKTSISRGIVKQLIKRGLSTEHVYPFKYLILTPIAKFFRGNKKVRKDFFSKREKRGLMRLWPVLVLLDNLLYYYLKIKPKSIIGKTIVCERFFYDFVTSFEYFGLIGKRFSKIYMRVIPRPDYVFVLDVPPQIAFEREGEHDLSFFAEQRNRYLKMAKKENFIVINTARPLKKTIQDIMQRLMYDFKN